MSVTGMSTAIDRKTEVENVIWSVDELALYRTQEPPGKQPLDIHYGCRSKITGKEA